MPQPHYSAIVPAPIDEVWAVVRDFGAISDWHPAVRDSRLSRGSSGAEVCAQRRFTLADGGAAVLEQLVALDDRSHTLTFAVVDGPFPVRDYVSTQRLTAVEQDDHTLLEWSADFDALDAAAADDISESVRTVFFVAGLEALQQRFA